ncbi:retrovirus-related Pol polyprotein from transposon TNT 1-94 [Senna tora]|uniref:Retrovirus-related Pol polyprotein from transposon TNT 1-94 n=1 Tax=Senna tora TaxID=362788 RepID=A0A834T922_9FABA|nr:retrovirus-related Pol polyprotein from transposon TNT 1-94 [Senna tora]
MCEKAVESSGVKSIPVVVQAEGVFNAGITLNESNYDVWSQLMEMHIAERGKLSYIRGKVKQPAESEDGYEKWYAENQKVKRWLLMSMTPEIMKRYLRLPTAYEIWSALSKAFYDGSDELQVFALNQKSFTAKQSGKSLSEYYGELVEIFRELDHRDKVIMKDPDDVSTYQKSVERLRVHIFLAGLNGDFEQIRGEILRKEPVPNLEDSYALVRREAVRRATLNVEVGNSEAATMVTRNRTKTSKGVEKSNYKCTHCDQTGHTKDCCYELVGYPEWWDHSRASRKRNSKKSPSAAVAETIANNDAVAKESALVTTTNTCGATNHMTFDSRQVIQLKPSSLKSVSTANGNEAPIIGEGHLSLTNKLDPDSVLVVPYLDYNLLSVSQITTALSCVVIFWPDYCVFKDIQTKQTIGYGIKQGKLYYLDLTSTNSDKLPQAFVHLHKHQRNKLAPRAMRCVFLGYAMHKKGYRCYHPPSQRMFITVDVVFHEESMYFSPESKLQEEYQKEIQTLDYDLITDVRGINLDLDINEHLENGEVIETHTTDLENEVIETTGVDPSVEELDPLSNIPYQSSTEDVPIPEPELPRKQLPERLTRAVLRIHCLLFSSQSSWHLTGSPKDSKSQIQGWKQNEPSHRFTLLEPFKTPTSNFSNWWANRRKGRLDARYE